MNDDAKLQTKDDTSIMEEGDDGPPPGVNHIHMNVQKPLTTLTFHASASRTDDDDDGAASQCWSVLSDASSFVKVPRPEEDRKMCARLGDVVVRRPHNNKRLKTQDSSSSSSSSSITSNWSVVSDAPPSVSTLLQDDDLTTTSRSAASTTAGIRSDFDFISLTHGGTTSATMAGATSRTTTASVLSQAQTTKSDGQMIRCQACTNLKQSPDVVCHMGGGRRRIMRYISLQNGAGTSISAVVDAMSTSTTASVSEQQAAQTKSDHHQLIPCPACTFLNPLTDVGCRMCEIPLRHDLPDDQLAAALQQQEDANKLLDRVPRCEDEELAQKILAVVDSVQRNNTTDLGAADVDPSLVPSSSNCYVRLVPLAHLTCLVSTFLSCLNHTRRSTLKIKFCYCFTSDRTIVQRDIMEYGFGQVVCFGSTPEAAAHAYREDISDLPNWARHARGLRLHPIEEAPQQLEYHDPALKNYEAPRNTVGWLVAIVGGAGLSSTQDRTIKVRSGAAWVYERRNSGESLPLVSFPSDKMETDTIRRLLNGLTKTFNDYQPVQVPT